MGYIELSDKIMWLATYMLILFPIVIVAVAVIAKKRKSLKTFIKYLAMYAIIWFSVGIVGSILGCSHDFITIDRTESTCVSEGIEIMQCTKCGGEKEKIISMMPHNYIVRERQEPTYNAAGEEILACEYCGDELSKEIPKLTHTHEYTEKVIIAVTCDSDGEKQYVCTKCGHTYSEIVKNTGHNYIEVEKIPATHTDDGVEKYKCQHCEKEKVEIIPQIKITSKSEQKKVFKERLSEIAEKYNIQKPKITVKCEKEYNVLYTFKISLTGNGDLSYEEIYALAKEMDELTASMDNSFTERELKLNGKDYYRMKCSDECKDRCSLREDFEEVYIDKTSNHNNKPITSLPAHYEVPYVGMAEGSINSTSLGAADEIEYCKDYYKLQHDRRSKEYIWYDSNGKTIFKATVHDDVGKVTFITDIRSGTIKSDYIGKKK